MTFFLQLFPLTPIYRSTMTWFNNSGDIEFLCQSVYATAWCRNLQIVKYKGVDVVWGRADRRSYGGNSHRGGSAMCFPLSDVLDQIDVREGVHEAWFIDNSIDYNPVEIL